MKQNIWTKEKIHTLFEQSFFELIKQAYICHKANFDINDMEFCVLSSIKTGGCSEDCAYCAQSKHHQTNVKEEKMLDLGKILEQAQLAKINGARRFCMGAAWRSPPQKYFPKILNIIKAIKALGLETCVTLGMLDKRETHELKKAGLDYYNHNLDTSVSHYSAIVTTRTYQDRLTTIANVIEAGINLCCGAILGIGENRHDRIEFLLALARLAQVPQSIPINQLIPIPGTPLENEKPLDVFEFIKTIAVTRIMFPKSRIKLAAGREKMSEEMQAWCFMAGVNAIFIGEKLLTAKNSAQNQDIQLLKKLNICTPNKR